MGSGEGPRQAISRRAFLRLAGLVGGTALVDWEGAPVARAQTAPGSLEPRAQHVASTDFGVGDGREVVARPDGLAPAASAGSAETAVTAAPAPFTYLMVRWRATIIADATITFEVRASEDGQAWTEWVPIQENEDLADPDAAPDLHWSSIVYTGLASFWQLRVTLGAASDGSVPVLHEAQVSTVDARGGDVRPEDPAPAGPDAVVAQPAHVSRSAWGGSEVQNNSIGPVWYTANHLVMHHTADANALRAGEHSWADRVRAIWSFHTYPESQGGRGWGDVGYNWLIDPNGVIYEGRNGSAATDRDAVGMHDAANYGSMGVALIGTFQPGIAGAITPTGAAQNALVRLFAWKASQRGIDPMGRSYYYGCSRSSACASLNPGAVVTNISGHRHVRSGTSCPGDFGVGILDSVRTRVKDAIAATPPPVQTARAELTGVIYADLSIEGGHVLQVRFAIRNTGTLALETQDPEPGRTDDVGPGHVYDEAESFLGDTAQSYPAFPKQTGRLRVALGGSEGGVALGSSGAGDSGGYPWRWGVGGTLQPGESRTVVGYVRFRGRDTSTRTITLKAALVNENVAYYASASAESTLTVTPERGLPEVSRTDSSGQPLAAVYRLVPMPWSLLGRATEAASIKEDAFVGTFAWDGAEQRWDGGGPLGLVDQYIVRQVRPFLAPESGTYTFELTSDDGSWLWIDGQPLISNAGLHPAQSVSASRWLPNGIHRLAVKYFQANGGASVRYSWIPPGGGSFRSIPVLLSGGAPRRDAVFGPGDQVALVADDFGGSGVRRIEYFVDGGSAQNQPGAMLTLGFTSGDHWIYYRAENSAGSWSSTELVYVPVAAGPLNTTLTASLQPTGVITLAWTSSPDARLFELQAYDGVTEQWTDIGRTSGRRLSFFGVAGHSYSFRIRAWDGLNWEEYTTPTAGLTVPPGARFSRTLLPLVGR